MLYRSDSGSGAVCLLKQVAVSAGRGKPGRILYRPRFRAPHTPRYAQTSRDSHAALEERRGAGLHRWYQALLRAGNQVRQRIRVSRARGGGARTRFGCVAYTICSSLHGQVGRRERANCSCNACVSGSHAFLTSWRRFVVKGQVRPHVTLENRPARTLLPAARQRYAKIPRCRILSGSPHATERPQTQGRCALN